jgi:hypothetical protein
MEELQLQHSDHDQRNRCNKACEQGAANSALYKGHLLPKRLLVLAALLEVDQTNVLVPVVTEVRPVLPVGGYVRELVAVDRNEHDRRVTNHYREK